MSDSFKIVQGDLLTLLFYKLSPRFGGLAGCSVFFDMALRGGGPAIINDEPAGIADGTYLIDGVSTVFTPADDVVFYQFKGTETATPGYFVGRFRVEQAGKSASFPPDSRIGIAIDGDIA